MFAQTNGVLCQIDTSQLAVHTRCQFVRFSRVLRIFIVLTDLRTYEEILTDLF